MNPRYYSNSMEVAHFLAAADRYRNAIAHAERRRLIRDSQTAFGASVAPTTTIRETVGTVLIKVGSRLQGAVPGAVELMPVASG